ENTAPYPAPKNWIDQSGDDYAVHQIANELGSLGQRTRNDSGRRGGEHRLKKEKGVRPSVVFITGQKKTRCAAEAVTHAEHQTESKRPVNQRPQTEVHQVLH